MQEIYLGVKRTPRSGRFFGRLVLGLVVVMVLLTAAYIVFAQVTGASPPEGELPGGDLHADGARLVLGESSLERSGELWVLRQGGTAFTASAAAARLLGDDDGRALDEALLGVAPDGGGWLARTAGGLGRRWRYRHLAEMLAPTWREELAGLVAGWEEDGRSPPSYQRLVWRQAALDLGRAVDGVGSAATSLTFVVASGGRVLVGRSFGLAGAPPATAPVVAFVRGNRVAVARVGGAFDVGVTTGISAEGLALFVAPAVSDEAPAADGLPLALVARDVLERAHSLDEAVTMVTGAKLLGAGSVLIVDGKAGAWAVVERTPSRAAVARRDQTVVGDVLVASEHARDAENDRARRGVPGARLSRLVELLGRGVSADPVTVAAVLRDRRGKGDAVLPAGSRVAVDDLAAAHVAILDATALVLWVGEGPGASGRMRPFDLRHELLGEPTRADVQPIPADVTLDPDVAGATALALRELHEAARADRLSRARAAAEARARARALAPDLAALEASPP